MIVSKMQVITLKMDRYEEGEEDANSGDEFDEDDFDEFADMIMANNGPFSG
jgi:hypothetical protein